MREAVGPHVELLIEVHAKFNVATAIHLGQRLEQYRPFWFEEPVSQENVSEMAQVRRHVRIPIATGERLFTKFPFYELIKAEAVDVLQPDICNAGGITELKKICARGEARGIPISPHNYSSGVCQAATLHLMAATPSTGPLEWDPVGFAIADELFVEPPVVRDGRVSVPQQPGLGVRLTDEVRAKYGR